jgi:hypothetical protein
MAAGCGRLRRGGRGKRGEGVVKGCAVATVVVVAAIVTVLWVGQPYLFRRAEQERVAKKAKGWKFENVSDLLAALAVPEDAKGAALILAATRFRLLRLTVVGKGDGGAPLLRPRNDIEHLGAGRTDGGVRNERNVRLKGCRSVDWRDGVGLLVVRLRRACLAAVVKKYLGGGHNMAHHAPVFWQCIFSCGAFLSVSVSLAFLSVGCYEDSLSSLSFCLAI